MSDFYTCVILLINQSEEIGEIQLSVLALEGAKYALTHSIISGPFQESNLNPLMTNKLAEWVVRFI